MITFACPGCMSTHSANEAFAGLRARCVVCGTAIVIPEDTGKVAAGWDPGDSSATGIPPAARRRRRPDDLEPDEDDDDPEVEESADDSADEPPKRKKKKRRVVSPAAEGDLLVFNKLDDEELLGNEDEDEAADEEETERRRSEHAESAKDALTFDSEPLLSPAERRKKRIRMAAAIGVTILCVSMAVYVVFFRGESTPKLEPQTQPTSPPPKKPTPPPKKADPPPPPPPLQVAPPPRPYRPTNRYIAAAYFLERNADPVAFDKLFGGTYLIIQGTAASVNSGSVTLADNTDIADSESIICSPPKLKPVGADQEPPPPPPIKPGQAVTVRGLYTTSNRMVDSEVVKIGSAADDEFADRDLEVAGVVGLAPQNESKIEQIATVYLRPSTTDCPIEIHCLFPAVEQEAVSKLKPGQPVTLRGRCTGRLFRTVSFHNCAFVRTSDQPNPDIRRVSSEQLFAAYERDLLPAPRPGPEVAPAQLTAERLAREFETSPREANLNLRFKPVLVTGRILELRARTNTVILQTGTNTRYQVLVAFPTDRFAKVHGDSEVMIRGVCSGIRDLRFVRIDNAELLEVEPHLIAEFLPFTPGRDLLYDSMAPAKLKDNAITQLKVRMSEPDLITTLPIRSGFFPGGTLFGGDQSIQPRWMRDLTRVKNAAPPVINQYRIKDDTVEIRPIPAPPVQPLPWWDPVLKLGYKRGETWSSETPDGRIVTYTVLEFSKDDSQRQTVDIRRAVKNPKAPMVWEEAVITYTRGLGETRRIVSSHSLTGQSVATLEMRLVESGLEGVVELSSKKEPEKKDAVKKDDKD